MKSENTAYGTGLMLLMTIVAAYVLAAAGLLVGVTVSAYVFPCAAVCGVLFCRSRQQLGLYAVAVALALMLAMLTYDSSCDGIMYHQEIISLLADGGNPYRMENLTVGTTLWTNHYAKAIEIAESAIVATFNRLESGKAVNYMLFFAISCLTWSAVSKTFTHWKRLKKCALTLAIVCNPIVFCQLPTYYIDYSKYATDHSVEHDSARARHSCRIPVSHRNL